MNALATCPLCHTADSALTSDAVERGAELHCARCDQRWGATRLATAAAYATWAIERRGMPFPLDAGLVADDKIVRPAAARVS